MLVWVGWGGRPRRELWGRNIQSAPVAANRIYISYRREDAAYPAGWLFDRLVDHLGAGQVFKDVDSIQPGDDFVEEITAAVGSCAVLLAVIGPRWLTVTGEEGQRRLDDPADFVRLEIEAAFARDVRVIPVLVDGARMPRIAELPTSLAQLARRQALELSPSRFGSDTARLLGVLDRQHEAKAEAEVERKAHEDLTAPGPGRGRAQGGGGGGAKGRDDADRTAGERADLEAQEQAMRRAARASQRVRKSSPSCRSYRRPRSSPHRKLRSGPTWRPRSRPCGGRRGPASGYGNLLACRSYRRPRSSPHRKLRSGPTWRPRSRPCGGRQGRASGYGKPLVGELVTYAGQSALAM